MTTENNSVFEGLLEDLSVNNGDVLSRVVSTVLNLAMKLEQEKALQAAPYERNGERAGHRNGYKDKTLRTRIGEVPVQIPQVRGMEFYPQSIEKGCRSEKALKLAIAQMYIQGVSTRKVTKIVEQLCGFGVTQAQVSDAAKLLDEEIEKWRNRALGAYEYLVIDATYEKVRMDKAVVSGALLIAHGIDKEGYRRVLGVSTKISEAEVHWREFFESLVARGLHGVKMITSDAHAGLKAARVAIFPTVPWQRCQFHLQQNAQHRITKKDLKKEVAADIRIIFNAENKTEAERLLNQKVVKYEKTQSTLSSWMEENVRESFTVFDIPQYHRKKLRTSNMAERQMKEIKRRTKVAMIFPNVQSLNRLAASLMMETDETWSTGKRYLKIDD
jgi:transposase-like protein